MNEVSMQQAKTHQTNVEVDLEWKNLSVRVQAKIKQKKKVDPLLEQEENYILNEISGYAKAGEMTAIMGPSGAGKTTLVACLANRIRNGKQYSMSGQIQANGQNYSDFTNFGAFVMQDDILIATLTVKETFLFVANLRMQENIVVKMTRVDQLIKDLNLRDCQNTLVGDGIRIKGISGGERKRTSIGCELIADPPVLILDEPTSGLDSFTAFICMNILKQITKNQRRTVIFTIHQPSTDIYNLFDRLILLSDGKVAYSGAASQLILALRDQNITIKQSQNPIDVAMSQISQGFMVIYQETTGYSLNQSIIPRNRCNNSFFFELTVLWNRAFTNYYRNPGILKTKIYAAVFMAIFLGILYWNTGGQEPSTVTDIETLQRYLQNLSGACFVCGTSAIFSALGPLLMLFPIERTIFLKEENAKLYRVSSYFVSKVLLEIPINVSITILLSLSLYWTFGFIWQIENLVQFIMITVFTSLVGNGLGIFTGTLFKDAKKSASLGPALLLPLQVFGGQQVNLDSLPSYISWFQYISPFKYFLEGFNRTQLEGVTFIVYGKVIDPMVQLGRTFGLNNCILMLGCIALGFHILGGIFLKLLVNKLNV